jgi:sulfonate transport system substrate-binding protein
MKNSIITFFAAALIAAGLFSPRASATDKIDTIKISGVVTYANGKIQLSSLDYAVEKQGWLRSELAKRGIKLEWYPVSGTATGPLTNEAFANHIIQFASYGDLPSIILNSNGAGETTQLLVPFSPEDVYLLVPKDSTAKSIEDIKGKRIAIHKGRPWELSLLRLLDSKGLTYSDFQVYNIDPQAGAAALASNGIDALCTLSAYGLEDKGFAKIIWSTKEAPLDWKIGVGIWGATDFIKQQPELTQLVVTAYVKGAVWASQEANKEELIKARTYTGASESQIRRSYDDPVLTWHDRWSPLFTDEVYNHYKVDIGYAFDKKITRRAIDVNELLNTSFVNQAISDLKLQDYWQKPKPGGVSQGTASATPNSTAAISLNK